MNIAVILLALFVLSVCGGCVQGPEDEEGFNFRQNTMTPDWPSPYDRPRVEPKPKGPFNEM
ncbi:MAG: hypothetical protein ACYSRP_03825 [Planctomycetota bacterium]|jgi:hypothetical protein